MLALWLALQAPQPGVTTCWRTVPHTSYSSVCIPASKLALYRSQYVCWRTREGRYEYSVPVGQTGPQLYKHLTRDGLLYADHRKP